MRLADAFIQSDLQLHSGYESRNGPFDRNTQL